MTSPSSTSGAAAVLTAKRVSTYVPFFTSRSTISDAPERLMSVSDART